ncbi:hypothetical protein Q8791_18390 [Nocardiopsis sp. CT-R113]|uniref:Lipoprotein n=1 Tax=Nocardiopsis codii TaxID=3065942 RepID=A0ABU7KAY8_9ACTN|nr:hypothetical protein [Nocardiopsis sp. CT-R113]MEE2039187.1 hypothetical protein [Nocardiopsis sp. CT-R113]
MVLPVVLMLSACGGGAEESDDPNAEAAAALYDAHPLHVRDATLVPEGSESGTYSELVTVQYSADVRASTELDKPECMDAANAWGELDGVQEAPASVAAYEWAEGSVSHMLVQLDEGTAAGALAARPPASCAAYTATYEDGTTTDYGVSDLEEVAGIGDESRAYSIEVVTGEEENRMFSLMYRNGGLVGTTSILGPGELEDYEEMLVDFSEAAVERQNQMLG